MKWWDDIIVLGVFKVGIAFFLIPTALFFLLDSYNYLLGDNKVFWTDGSWTPRIFENILTYFAICAIGGGIVGLITALKREAS